MTAATAPEAKRIKSARTRNMTAAKKLIAQIAEAAAAHTAALGESTAPGNDLAALTAKYEQARGALVLLDGLGTEPDPEPEPDATANGHAPGAEDVGLLIGVMRAYALVPETADPDSPLGHLVSFAFPDGDLPPYGGMVPAPHGSPVPGAPPAAPAQGGTG
jgi:hypothetical protein